MKRVTFFNEEIHCSWVVRMVDRKVTGMFFKYSTTKRIGLAVECRMTIAEFPMVGCGGCHPMQTLGVVCWTGYSGG